MWVSSGTAKRSDGFLKLSDMNILWSPEDRRIEDLNSLRLYIAQDNPPAARGVVLHITIEHLLPYNPQMGRPGRVLGTRELEIPKTLSSSPIDCIEMSFKLYASITGRVVGLKAFSSRAA